MRELFNQHGEAIIGGAVTALVLGGLAAMVFGGGFAQAAHLFSRWLYG